MAAGLAGCSRPHRGSPGTPRPAGKCSPPTSPGTTWGLEPGGRALNISEGRCPRGTVIRYLNNLTWLASVPTSSSSNPSSFQISELLTLSLMLILSRGTSFRPLASHFLTTTPNRSHDSHTKFNISSLLLYLQLRLKQLAL